MAPEFKNYGEFTLAELEAVKLVFWVEQVVPIKGWPGYAISYCGRVFSKVTHDEKREMRISELQVMINPVSGKREFVLSNSTRNKILRLSRLLAIHFLPPPKEGECVVRHLNDEIYDNRPENLAWGTQSDNMYDSYRNQTRRRRRNKINQDGRRATDLSEDEIREVRRLRREEKWPYCKLCRRFAIRYQTARNICVRHVRKDVA